MWLATPNAALAIAGETPVILMANADCAVYVDGQLAHAAVKANGTERIAVTPGEHVFTAECVGGKTWKQVVIVGTTQKVVQIDVMATSAAAATPAHATGAARKRTVPPTGLHDLEGKWVGEVRKKAQSYSCRFYFSPTKRWQGPNVTVPLTPGEAAEHYIVGPGDCELNGETKTIFFDAGHGRVVEDRLVMTMVIDRKRKNQTVDFLTGEIRGGEVEEKTEDIEAMLSGGVLSGKGKTLSVTLTAE